MTPNLPFTYPRLLKNKIHKNSIKTVLDLGCGDGDLARLINNKNEFEITGVDIFGPYLKICKKEGKYQKVIKMDITKKLPFKDNSFDAVICLQTIEHVNKKAGIKLMERMEKIARKVVIVGTPVGECIQEEYDNNPHQRHLSSWNPKDFQQKGYRVYGFGLKFVYGSYSHVQQHVSLKKVPLSLLSFLMNPIANYLPNIGCQALAIKYKNAK
jgi:SAM-dependent methyltransferase